MLVARYPVPVKANATVKIGTSGDVETTMGEQKPLTAKQQGFTDSILDGCSQADAYRNNYNCGNMSGNAIRVEASRLANNPCVALMVAEKRQAAQAAKMWTRQMALLEAETNLEMARDAKQMGPANQALKIAVALSGLSKEFERLGDVQVTQVTVVLNQ
jgi:hypothetical protein